MGIKRGPNIFLDNLVFGFDTGFPLVSSSFDTYRFNAGEPTTNLANTDTKRTLENHNPSGYNSTMSLADAPEKGLGWKKVTITTHGSNHRLAQFPYVSHTSGSTLSFSIEYDFNGLSTSTGSQTSNYYWKLDGSTGTFGDATPKDNGYQKSHTFTRSSNGVQAIFLANANTNRANINDVIYYKNYQVEEKSHNTPFTTGSRGATEGLFQITGSQTLDLTNVSFDSNAHMEFDGTDDTIPITSITLGNGNWTIEAVVNAHSNGYNLLSNSSGGPVSNAFGVNNNKIHYRNYDGAWQAHDGEITVNHNQIYHLTWVNRSGGTNSTGTMDMYVNGVKDGASGFNSFTTNGGPVNAIGRNWFSFFNGQIFIFRYYNDGLTDQQVADNFNTIKDRFDI